MTSSAAAPIPSPSHAQLIAVAEQVYGSTNLAPCDIPSRPPDYFKNCPFTPAFKAQLDAVPGVPASTWETPAHPAGGYEILCHCQGGFGVTQLSFTAVAGGSGGTVTVTGAFPVRPGSYVSTGTYILTIVSMGGRLLVDAIVTNTEFCGHFHPIQTDPWSVGC